ncbi:hypothetical protein ABH924_003753 [Arthrobacter sp. GAS37]|uniref:hypothetical protein n=1 Tax=Arthrobacter sp. GAS37 TaxID=3156261 RepID=UPI0038333E51
MSQAPESAPSTEEPSRLDQAIEVMTALFRETHDYSEAVTIVLASVAANAGSSYALISGRPGSWESDVLSQLLGSTVSPDDDALMQYRTEPITVKINVEEALADLGVLEPWDYEDRLMRRLEGLGTTEAQPDGGTLFTPDDPEGYEEKIEEYTRLAEAYEQKYQAEAEAYFVRFEANVRAAATAEDGQFAGLPAHIRITAQRVTDTDAGHALPSPAYLTLEERLYLAAFEATLGPDNLENDTFA